MISIKLNGGLGNQLFQIATTYVHAKNNRDVCAFNFNVQPVHQGNSPSTYINNIYKKLTPLRAGWFPRYTYKEAVLQYHNIPYKENMMLEGYFGSAKYIGAYRNNIVELFTDDFSVNNLRRGFGAVLPNSVSLHVRRGDYLKFTDVYVQLPWSYYDKALNIIKEKCNIEHIIIFSDDIEWCKHNIELDNVYFSVGMADYNDLYLMSLCTHNIMANSSFSWWGSYLNQNPNKIIVAPEKWFITEGVSKGRPENAEPLFCDNWIKI